MVSEVIKAVVQSTASTINYIHWSIDTAVQKERYIYRYYDGRRDMKIVPFSDGISCLGGRCSRDGYISQVLWLFLALILLFSVQRESDRD